MADLAFTPAQMARLRAMLAVPPGDPDPTAADLLAVLEATRITDAESARWDGDGPPRWRQ